MSDVDRARRVAFDVLRAVSSRDAYANLVLDSIRREAGLQGRDAAFATELAYGTLRGRGTYDLVIAACIDRPLERVEPALLDALRLGAHQLLATRVPPHAAVSQTVALVRDALGHRTTGFANAVLRRVARDDRAGWLARVAPDPTADPTGHRAAVHAHPAWVVTALAEALAADGRPDDLDALLASHNDAAPVTLAARPGLVDAADLRGGQDDTPGRWSPYAVLLSAGDPGAVAAVADGRAGVQDEGSQLACLLLAAAPLAGPDGRWLDLCAGPGGKAALLGGLAAGRGAHLVAHELAPHRAELVRGAVRRLGGAVTVRVGDGRAVGAAEPRAYDRVLVDVPCTGLGALRRRPEARWRRTPEELGNLAALQRALLDSALDATRPGGVVCYATCSPHLTETTGVVHQVLDARSDAAMLDARAVVADVPGLTGDLAATLPDRRTVQLWPHVHGTDAMFVALLRRR